MFSMIAGGLDDEFIFEVGGLLLCRSPKLVTPPTGSFDFNQDARVSQHSGKAPHRRPMNWRHA